MMPAVTTMGGSRGRSSWTCDSERARTTKIEVLYPPHMYHFSRPFKGTRFYAREVTINDAQSLESPTNHGKMEIEVEGDKIEARKPGIYLLCRLRNGGVLLCVKWGLNSSTSRGDVRPLSIKHVWKRPWGRALRCPVL